MRDLFSLGGKVALVTGASRGIGLASARLLAQAGAAVMVSSEDDACAAAAAELGQYGRVAHQICDVTSKAALASLVCRTDEVFGRLDIVVANAGISLSEGPMAAVPEADYAAMMAVNLHATVQLCLLASPLLSRGGGGSIIVMSSLAGLRGNRSLGVYGMTKAANAQLVRNLAVEWGASNIRANAIAPGLIDTGFADAIKANSAALATRMARTPLRRMGTPEEVAGTVLWLASPAGAFVTGQTIVVDGGTLVGD